ncbi:heparinase II/III family protein [Peterkaempfera sp. SMS 1(5)a]|uniref:heparinase II/III domain-containing protein n=1 Tax=Peterkaempfera podocarpi TaxID=3232308 RepID=UPI0036725C22
MNPAPGTLGRRLAPLLDGDTLAAALRGCADRLPVPRAEDRAAWQRVTPASRTALLREADAELVRPAPVLRASDWARTFRDGVRTAHEDAFRALRHRAALLATAAVLADDHAAPDAPPGAAPYLDATADSLLAVLETSTWCWAPHDRHTADRREQLPDPDRPFLDLGVAEAALLLAWADHALGIRLQARLPGIRRRIRREVRLRVLEPFRNTRDWHWLGLHGDAHNWNPWIHHAVLTCALLLTDDGPAGLAERADLVRLVVAGLDLFVDVLPDDGGIDEGISYWWLGAGQLLECLDLLADATAGALDARDLPLLRQLLRYPRRVHLGGNWYANVGDAPARLDGHHPWHLPHRWARRLDDPATAAHAAVAASAHPVDAHPEQGLGRALAGLSDPHWRAARTSADASTPTTAPASAPDAPGPDRDTWLPRVELLVARERAGDTDGLTLAVKGGHNAERHNHLDVGSYLVALDGRPLVVDIGKPTYTAASFGPDRYQAWPLVSAWHNTPEPGGHGQLPGTRHRARDTEAHLDDDTATFRTDLAAAYPDGLLRAWHRTVHLHRSPRPEILVEDHPDGLPPGTTVRLHHVLAGHVALADDHALLTAPGDRVLRLDWDPALLTPHLTPRPLDDPELTAVWGHFLTRLTLTTVFATTGAHPLLRVRLSRSPD